MHYTTWLHITQPSLYVKVHVAVKRSIVPTIMHATYTSVEIDGLNVATLCSVAAHSWFVYFVR